MALDIAPLPPLQHGKPNEEASQTKAAQVAIQERGECAWGFGIFADQLKNWKNTEEKIRWEVVVVVVVVTCDHACDMWPKTF
jgi:hypothetical protein